MVLPWLFVGASAAWELHRRTEPEDDAREVSRLRTVEQSLTQQKEALTKDLEEACTLLQDEQASHDEDKQRLMDLERIKEGVEKRMLELHDMAENLVNENHDLKEDNQQWKQRADEYLNQNIALLGDATSLREENESLRHQLRVMTDSSEEKSKEMEAMLGELKDTISHSMQKFTNGECTAIELQARMKELGVQMDCNTEQLSQIQSNRSASIAMSKDVSRQFNNQLTFVMEDRSRLEHLMGIAQKLRVPSGPSAQQHIGSESTSDSGSSTPSAAMLRHHSASEQIPKAPPADAQLLGGGFFRSLGWGGAQQDAKGSLPRDMSEMSLGSIASARDPSELSSRSDTAVSALEPVGTSSTDAQQPFPAVETVAAMSPEVLPASVAKKKKAQPKGLFGMRFKGLPEQKKDSNFCDGPMPVSHSISGTGDDDNFSSSSALVLK